MVPDFYCVYLLQSLKTKSFYIGSTPNPPRRLRQHNGLIKLGAFRTKLEKKRPWEMVLLVHGFPSKVTALQFEHALQHPQCSRHFSEQTSTGRSQHFHLGNVRVLVNCQYFARMDLEVDLFNNDTEKVWRENKYRIQGLVDASQRFKDVEHCLKVCLDRNTIAEKLIRNDICFVCENKSLQAVFCPRCGECFCETCLAKEFLAEENQNALVEKLLPYKADCPQCSQAVTWKQVVSFNLKLRARTGEL